jgi:hypothetical protein
MCAAAIIAHFLSTEDEFLARQGVAAFTQNLSTELPDMNGDKYS